MSGGQGGSDFTPPPDETPEQSGPSGSDFTPPPDETPEQSGPSGAGTDVAEEEPDDDRAGREAAMAELVGEAGPDPDQPVGADAGDARRVRSPTGPAPQSSPTGGLGPGEATERFGHLVRHYRMGVSGAALALAWARQEHAPDGATVVVEREVSPLGRLGRLWTTPPESTLSCAIVLRPPLSVEEADAIWLLAGVAAAEGAAAASDRELATWWPDLVVHADSGDEVAAVKVEIQLGPGKVRSAVATIRVNLDTLGLGSDGREAVLEGILGALDRNSADLAEGSAGVAAAYDGRCGMLGRRVKLRLLPKGETRGVARGVDRSARLELESSTGMVQKVAIDSLRAIEAV